MMGYAIPIVSAEITKDQKNFWEKPIWRHELRLPMFYTNAHNLSSYIEIFLPRPCPEILIWCSVGLG
jgi:hypothetical protein